MSNVIEKVKHGLWQLSLGTHGFEEPNIFSKYVVDKSKELLTLLDETPQPLVEEDELAALWHEVYEQMSLTGNDPKYLSKYIINRKQ